MVELRVIIPASKPNDRLLSVLEMALEGVPYDAVISAAELTETRGRHILFVLSLDELGLNEEYGRMQHILRRSPDFFEGSVAGIVVDGEGELYTKDAARDLAFVLNQGGCALIGRPLVEGTKSLSNFQVLSDLLDADRLSSYQWAVHDLVRRLLGHRDRRNERPKLLVLHASSNIEQSNTIALYRLVREHLSGVDVREINLGQGAVRDCKGCTYKTCFHFGQQNTCFYGGVVVDEVFPAFLESDGVLLLCPNYNDALGANLVACINRLTALFRKQAFQEKKLFAIVVSGYSGGDIVAKQCIAALNMNKSLFLPPRFALLETANAPRSVVGIPGIGEKARQYAVGLRHALRGE